MNRAKACKTIVIALLTLIVLYSGTIQTVLAHYYTPQNFRWFVYKRLAGSGYIMDNSQWRYVRYNLYIKAVLNVRTVRDDATYLASLGIKYKWSPITNDQAPSISQALDCVQWIQRRLNEGRRVLVHCSAGIGRTATILACWYVYRGYSARSAIAWVYAHPKTSMTYAQKAFIYTFEHHVRYHL